MITSYFLLLIIYGSLGWPRGLPLQDIKFNASQVTLKPRKIPSASVGIVQSLANHDPDVDAIYRLTQPLPFDFPSKGLNVAVPKGSFAPYNAQATLHLYSALWSLLLPVTVHGRVSDIWRGYATKRLLDLLDLRLVFSPALVRQDRNVHNYLADFDSESDLYLRAQRLLEHLAEWQPSAVALKSEHPLAACMEEIYVMMYEHGYLQLRDVELVQAWLHSLVAAGYKFPHIGGSSGSGASETEGSPKSKGNSTSTSSSTSTGNAKNGNSSS
jgi:STELLO glycosyltransferases